MPRINRGLTKLLNNSDVLKSRVFSNFQEPQLINKKPTELTDEFDKLLKQIDEKTDEFRSENSKNINLFDNFIREKLKLDSLPIEEEGLMANGNRSLLKSLKSKKAIKIIRDLNNMLNKSADSSQTKSIITDMDIFMMSDDIKKPLDRLLAILPDLDPESPIKTNPKLYLDTFKTPTVEMAEELFKRFPESSRKNH